MHWAATLALTLAAQCIAQPGITFVTGDARPTSGGAMCRITGSNLMPNPLGPAPQVFFDATAASVLLASNTLIVCLTPVGDGSRVVTVVNGGTSNGVGYTYDAPVITALSPATGGPIAGGFTLGIGGSNFGASPTVRIGGAAATIVSATHTIIQCIVPAGLGTDKDVAVTDAGQNSTGGPKFSYAGPTIQIITPSSGPGAAGGTMGIQGMSLGLAGKPQQPVVTIGGQTATLVSVDPALVRVQIPSGSGTNLPVVITRAGQTATAGVAFSYNAPFLNNINPPSGSTAGGYPATITGANFGPTPSTSSPSGVMIGNVPATVVSWSNSSITVTVPPGQGANRTVVVTANGQNSTTLLPFFYDGPILTNIRPAFGPAAGGTPIVIDGLNFGTAATVSIGGLPATVTSQTHTSIACIVPTRSGATGLATQVQVTVALQPSNSQSYAYLCAADFDRSGTTGVQDIFDFLAAWFSGCP